MEWAQSAKAGGAVGWHSRNENVGEGGGEKSWGGEGGRGLGIPGLTSVVTIRLRPMTAPSKKKPRIRRQRRMTKGRNTKKTRICPGGSGQKPEVRSSREKTGKH